MSFSVRKTRFRFSFTRVKTSPNSGVLWWIIGSAPAADTSGGIGVGPGDIRRYLCLIGGGFLSYRGQLDTHFRHCRCRWLHAGADILQSVAFWPRLLGSPVLRKELTGPMDPGEVGRYSEQAGRGGVRVEAFRRAVPKRQSPAEASRAARRSGPTYFLHVRVRKPAG